MNDRFSPLIDTIEEHVRLHGELLEAARDRSRLMVDLDKEALARTEARAEGIVVRIRANEERRRTLSDEAARWLGLRAPARLAEIARAVGDPARARFLDLRSRLARLVDDVARANATNRALAAQGLRHVDSLLRVLTGADADLTVYGRPYGQQGLAASGLAPRALVLDRVA